MAVSYTHFQPGVPLAAFTRATVATEFRDIMAPDAPNYRSMIGYPIHSDGGTLSGGSYETTLPLTNMLTRDHTERARTTSDGTSATQFDLDLGSDELDWLVRAIGIFGHNLSKLAKWKVTGSDESDFGPAVYESDWKKAYESIYPWGVLNPGEPGYLDGRPAPTQPTGIPLQQFVPEGTACRYWRFEFDDTTNPDTWLEFGRLIVAYAWQLGQNFVVGAAQGVDTETTRRQSEGGTLFHDERPVRRSFVGAYPELEEDEALVRVHDFKMLVGTSQQFLWVEKPDSAYHKHRGTFPAVMEKLSPLNYPAGHQRRSQGVTIMEEF